VQPGDCPKPSLTGTSNRASDGNVAPDRDPPYYEGMVDAELYGLYPADAKGPFATVDIRNPSRERPTNAWPINIASARHSQAKALSEEAFFAENGFVLLKHETAVSDWDNVPPVFCDEIDELIRKRLLPGKRLEIQQRPTPMRRGRGTANPHYAQGVHSDGPMTAELYGANVGAFAGKQAQQWWLDRYRRDDVAGFMSIDFWRTTNMAGPLQHMPLALCTPQSVERSDMLAMEFRGIAPEGRLTHHLALRFNPAQRWYFYPQMTADEVLAFKLCEFSKDEPNAHPQNCFHSAFYDPSAPQVVEERQSCEHRIGVLILRD